MYKLIFQTQNFTELAHNDKSYFIYLVLMLYFLILDTQTYKDSLLKMLSSPNTLVDLFFGAKKKYLLYI